VRLLSPGHDLQRFFSTERDEQIDYISRQEVKEYNTEGVNEPRTLDTSVRKPYGTAEGVLVEVLPPSV